MGTQLSEIVIVIALVKVATPINVILKLYFHI